MNTLEWLKKLVAYDTTSRLSNLPLIQDVQTFLEKHHIPSRLTYDATGKKANLFATLPAKNGKTDGGVILSGHTDCVPVDNQAWDTDPFSATIREDKMYGRGTCDMKGFIAAVLGMLPHFQHELKSPVHLAFSYDEEIGCKGAPGLIHDFLSIGIKPRACIVGEPTDMRPIIAHKGIQLFRCHVHGEAAHSSLTNKGCNAIEYASELIYYLRQLADQLKLGPQDVHFDVPFTTLSTNQIEGGIAVNTIPHSCSFLFEFRQLPSVDAEKIKKQIAQHVQTVQEKMQREHPEASIELINLAQAPAFEAKENAELTQLIQTLTKETEKRKVGYATEAGLFQNVDIPTIVCGPGNIEQAHRANEFVTLAQLKKCEEFLVQLLK